MVLASCQWNCVLSVVWLRSSLICGGACRFLDDGLRLEGGSVEGGDSVDYGYVEITDMLGYCWRTMSVQMDFSKSSKGDSSLKGSQLLGTYSGDIALMWCLDEASHSFMYDITTLSILCVCR